MSALSPCKACTAKMRCGCSASVLGSIARLLPIIADSAESGRSMMDTADFDRVRTILARRPDEDDDAYLARTEELRATYAERYGGGDPEALDHMLDEEFTADSSDNQYLTDLAEDGVVSPERQLRYAFEGHLGTNSELAMAALRDEHGDPLPREEIDAIVAAYDGEGGDLRAEVVDDAIGRTFKLLHLTREIVA